MSDVNLHAQIMNIQPKPYDGTDAYTHYCLGHKDARHAAAELALEADIALTAAQAEIERLRIGYDRYETARRMNPLQFKEAWLLNINTGNGFDEIVDDLRPFYFPTPEATNEG